MRDMIDVFTERMLGDLSESKGYVLPMRKTELAPRTRDNLKKRAKLFEQAIKKIEDARDLIGQIPRIDFMGDLVHISSQISEILDGDGSGSGIRKELLSVYQREAREK